MKEVKNQRLHVYLTSNDLKRLLNSPYSIKTDTDKFVFISNIIFSMK